MCGGGGGGGGLEGIVSMYLDHIFSGFENDFF